MRTLILGGTRSGKSTRAEQLVAGAAQVRYLATGRPAGAGDADWDERLARHTARRDGRYRTVETLALADELRADPDVTTVIDDLGNWVTRLLDELGGWEDRSVDLAEPTGRLCAAVAEFRGDLVIVSNEVGMSVVPDTAAGRRFQDLLGITNSSVARACERLELVVAGRVLASSAAPADEPISPPAEPEPATEPAPASGPPPVDVAPVPETPVPAASVPAATVPAATVPAGLLGSGADVDPTDAEVFAPVELPDDEVADAARARQLTLTKPAGSLGRLEELGVWVSSCQGLCPPRPLRAAQVVVFAGDHGVARDGVSAFPPEVTAQMVANIAAGGAAVNVLARRAGATVHVVDMSVDCEDPDPQVAAYKVCRSSGDLRRGAAMTLAQARQSVAAGRRIADQLIDAGADLLIAGDMGIGNTTPSAVIVGTITGKEPVLVVGRGTGVDDEGWKRKTAAIRDGMRHGRRHRHDPLSLLAAVGGADLGAMAGFLAQAAVRKTPAILDGLVVTAAALLANELAPGATAWWQAGHRSTEPAHGFALEELGLTPIVDMSMRLGEGTGAVTALPVVAAAVDVLADMATFAEAGVADGD